MVGRTWPLRLEVAGPEEQGGTSSIRSFWLLEASCFTLSPGCMLYYFIMFLVFDTHAALSDGKRKNDNSNRRTPVTTGSGAENSRELRVTGVET